MDGARLALAATALGCTLREITTDLGVDVVAFGGTKLGMLLGEAVVFLNPQLAQQAHQSCPFWRKQAMQLASKMRFISAQFVALLEGDLWQRNACHALDMTKLLEKHLREALHLHPVMPVAANTVFIRLPKTVYEALQAEMPCYAWCKPVTHQGDEGFSGSETEVITRLMTSYATQPEEITWLVETLRRLLVSPANA
jgi:threonine aldolase